MMELTIERSVKLRCSYSFYHMLSSLESSEYIGILTLNNYGQEIFFRISVLRQMRIQHNTRQYIQ